MLFTQIFFLRIEMLFAVGYYRLFIESIDSIGSQILYRQWKKRRVKRRKTKKVREKKVSSNNNNIAFVSFIRAMDEARRDALQTNGLGKWPNNEPMRSIAILKSFGGGLFPHGAAAYGA